MHVKTRNVNTAFRYFVEGIHNGTIPTEVRASRVGEVLSIPEPVIITYEKPKERVLLNAARDANPFFALYEALWMLAGRNDVAPLAYYNSKISGIASDNNVDFNGAYGYRWRHAVSKNPTFVNTWNKDGTDQLSILINHLRNKPESRRAVLAMWNTQDDLLKIDKTLDCCCNLNIVFAVELGRCKQCENWDFRANCTRCNGKPHDQPRYLNMTVFNRSNDILWGALGSNYVTFSVLLEYMAANLDLDVGVYNQCSNNLHVYTERWKPELWLADSTYNEPRHSKEVDLVYDPKTFDNLLPQFVERHSRDAFATPYNEEPFLNSVAQPLCIAFHHYKRKEINEALNVIEHMKDTDWKGAAYLWLLRRVK